MKVNNEFFSFFWDRFDMPVRYFYCRLPFLGKLLFWRLYRSNFKKLDARFERMKKCFKKIKFSFKDKICLEVGPGNSYINAYNLLMSGARKVILIDKFPRTFETRKQKIFFEKELSFIKRKYREKRLFFVTKNGEIDSKYIEFVVGDLVQYNFEEKFDLIVSVSVLEHVKNLQEVVSVFSKIIKPRGAMYHYIDLRDHYNFSNPFLFYKYSKRVWEKYLTKEGISYTNRVRFKDFVKLFTQNGFKIVFKEVERFSLPKREISKDFKFDSDDLSIGLLEVLLRK